MTAPERIWAIPYEGSPDTGWFFPGQLKGTTEYTRSDLCDRDAIRAEAFEEAAKMIEATWVRLPDIAISLAAAIRAKAEGGNRT